VKHRFITIEGNIGAGKTTLATRLAKDFNGKLILEGFADNPFLPPFYENKERYAFPLELYFMAERYQQLKAFLTEQDLFSAFTVSDYLFVKSLLFARVNLSEDEFKLYSTLFNIINPTLPQPDLVVYLHSPVDKLKANINKRGREYEKNISEEYLWSLHQTYMDYFRTALNLKTVVIDISEINFAEHESDYNKVVQIINANYLDGINVIPNN